MLRRPRSFHEEGPFRGPPCIGGSPPPAAVRSHRQPPVSVLLQQQFASRLFQLPPSGPRQSTGLREPQAPSVGRRAAGAGPRGACGWAQGCGVRGAWGRAPGAGARNACGRASGCGAPGRGAAGAWGRAPGAEHWIPGCRAQGAGPQGVGPLFLLVRNAGKISSGGQNSDKSGVFSQANLSIKRKSPGREFSRAQTPLQNPRFTQILTIRGNFRVLLRSEARRNPKSMRNAIAGTGWSSAGWRGRTAAGGICVNAGLTANAASPRPACGRLASNPQAQPICSKPASSLRGDQPASNPPARHRPSSRAGAL